jgi:hypothetical protein
VNAFELTIFACPAAGAIGAWSAVRGASSLLIAEHIVGGLLVGAGIYAGAMGGLSMLSVRYSRSERMNAPQTLVSGVAVLLVIASPFISGFLARYLSTRLFHS